MTVLARFDLPDSPVHAAKREKSGWMTYCGAFDSRMTKRARATADDVTCEECKTIMKERGES